MKESCFKGRICSKAGFTLIELLVVVLIIGILAAVAVPQYQKAVEKSKATQAKTLAKSVYQAAQAYKLANGKWPSFLSSLDITIPWSGNKRALTPTYYTTKSNEEWSLELANNDSMNGVWIIRNSGNYAGAGFVIRENEYVSGNGVVPKDQLLCVEGSTANHFVTNFTSKNKTGDYCRKIVGGNEIDTQSGTRFFTLK